MATVPKVGVNVIDAKDAITITVEGGQLIGVDSGALDYTGSFKTNTRNAYEGRLLVTVQKSASSNEVRIRAAAAGLTNY
ncbi:MAG: hypothetical protein ABIN93_12595 [Ginsengibacter sp.]